MSDENLPFGFAPRDPDDENGGAGSGGSGGTPNPFGFGAGGFDPSNLDMSQLGAAMQQLGAMLQSGGGDGSAK